MIKLFLLFAVIIFSGSEKADPKLVGKWSASNGMGVEFKKDNTFNVFVNTKVVIKGTYTATDETLTYKETFSMPDNTPVCVDQEGSYKITFSGDTAVSFKVITDLCDPRRDGNDGAVMSKVK